MAFARLQISVLNHTCVSFKYGIEIRSIFYYRNSTVLTVCIIMLQGV